MAQKLFSNSSPAPWADSLRPANFDEFIGQQHLVGERGPLASRPLHSMLLWGPPGCGKTTLALMLASKANAQLAPLSPVSSGVKDLKKAIESARLVRDERGQQTIVFVDEAHRFNKAQQDYFLPHVESGLIIFIGATTENPSFEINSALLSRLVVYRLVPLTRKELKLVLKRAILAKELDVADEVGQQIIEFSDGDARRLLNTLEQLSGSGSKIDAQAMQDMNLAQLRRHDKRGDEFYDQISAMIKSVRGSNPDAALYWLCRMLDGGAPPTYISRRLIRLATEDIGMADPHALSIAVNADSSYRMLGSPEGELGLALAAVYLATAPKSNALYGAFKQISGRIAKGQSEPVPMHLRNAPTSLMKDQGNSVGYRYAHDEPHGYAAGATYLPDGMKPINAYAPTGHGFEKVVAKRMAALRELDEKSAAKHPDK